MTSLVASAYSTVISSADMEAELQLPSTITSLADALGGHISLAYLYEISPGLHRLSELHIDLPGVGHAVFFFEEAADCTAGSFGQGARRDPSAPSGPNEGQRPL